MKAITTLLLLLVRWIVAPTVLLSMFVDDLVRPTSTDCYVPRSKRKWCLVTRATRYVTDNGHRILTDLGNRLGDMILDKIKPCTATSIHYYVNNPSRNGRSPENRLPFVKKTTWLFVCFVELIITTTGRAGTSNYFMV